jgi:hypothetical protein
LVGPAGAPLRDNPVYPVGLALGESAVPS